MGKIGAILTVICLSFKGFNDFHLAIQSALRRFWFSRRLRNCQTIFESNSFDLKNP